MRRMTIMKKIYRFLEVKATSNSFARDRLKDTPCIVVEEGRRFVRVEQVVIELNREFEIQPFLYGLPAELLQCKVLFQYLGCASVAKVSHFAMVLDMLKEKCKEKPLDPNEKMCALTAERGIFETLQNHSNGGHSLSSLNLQLHFHQFKKMRNLPCLSCCRNQQRFYLMMPHFTMNALQNLTISFWLIFHGPMSVVKRA